MRNLLFALLALFVFILALWFGPSLADDKLAIECQDYSAHPELCLTGYAKEWRTVDAQ